LSGGAGGSDGHREVQLLGIVNPQARTIRLRFPGFSGPCTGIGHRPHRFASPHPAHEHRLISAVRDLPRCASFCLPVQSGSTRCSA
jgi:hypothetical protein